MQVTHAVVGLQRQTLLSPYGYVHHSSMSVCHAVLPVDSKVTNILSEIAQVYTKS